MTELATQESTQDRRSADMLLGSILESQKRIEERLKALEDKHAELRDDIIRGKGFVAGVALAAAGIGGGLGAWLHKFFT